MWIVAGVLLGIVVLSSILGFHTGPHGHLAASGLGVLAAVWLVLMAATGHGQPILWTLLSADVIASAGVGAAAWKGLGAERALAGRPARDRLIGADGVALSALTPDGVVRVNGEEWSARALNGDVQAGDAVQVVDEKGVRLEVWGVAALGEQDGAPPKFTLDDLLQPDEAQLTDRDPGVASRPRDPAPLPNEKKASQP